MRECEHLAQCQLDLPAWGYMNTAEQTEGFQTKITVPFHTFRFDVSDISALLATTLRRHVLKLLPRQPVKHIPVLVLGGCTDFVRQFDSILPSQPLLRQPVPHNLLVKAVLVPPGLIRLRVPEARRIGRQDLVSQNHLVLAIQRKLELGVGDDDAALGRVLRCRSVDLEREILHLGRVLGAKNLGRLVRVDVLIVLALGRLGGGRVERGRKLLALAESGREGDAVGSALGLVLLPGGAGKVAAHDGLDG